MEIMKGHFDMLGIASPLLVKGKANRRDLLIKESNLDWDTYLPDKMSSRWITFIEELVELDQLQFQRCVRKLVEWHFFTRFLPSSS